MTNGDIVFISNSPFFVDRILRLSFQVVHTRESAWICFRNVNNYSFFKSCKFPWIRFTIYSLRNRMNSFGEFWRNCILHLGEKCWNAWRIERFCVVIVQSSQMLRLFRYVKFWGFFPLFVQYCKRSSVRGDKSINKWPNVTDVASLYQSTSNKPSPKWTLSLPTSNTSRGDLNRTIWVFRSSISLPNLLLWNKLCFI